jgi:type II secretory pathway component PulF
MALYEYKAATAAGDRTSGHISAKDEAVARRRLAARGLTILEIRWCLADETDDPMGAEQTATLVQAVGAAAASRVPLDVTLAALAEEKEDPQLAAVAGRMATRLAQGATIEETIEELDHNLPREVRGLLRAGVESGDMAGTFEQFAQQRLARQRVDRQIRAAIAYPLLILSILVPVLLLLSVFVIPMFRELFEEFDLQLPHITKLVVSTSQQLPPLIGALVLLAVAIPLGLRLVGGRWLFHRVRNALPVFGRLWTWAGQREFADVLASFLELRLPLADAVAHTGEILGDRSLARACTSLRERLEAGRTLGESLNQSIHFDRTLSALATWGESHGLLPEALRIATDVFDDQVEQQASFVRRLLPPVTLVVVATLMVSVIIGLMVPLSDLIQGLSG